MTRFTVWLIAFAICFVPIMLIPSGKNGKAKFWGGLVFSCFAASIAMFCMSVYLWNHAPRKATCLKQEQLFPSVVEGKSYFASLIESLPDRALSHSLYSLSMKDGVFIIPSNKVECIEEDRLDAVLEEYSYKYEGRFEKFSVPEYVIGKAIRIPKGSILYQVKRNKVLESQE